MRRKITTSLLPGKYLLIMQVFFGLLLFAFAISAQEISLKPKLQNGDFALVDKKHAADVLFSPADFKVVNIAAKDLTTDVERVTGKKPPLKSDLQSLSKNVVIIGTLGKSPFIDDLVQRQKINAAQIQNKWESFLILTVKNPFPNVENALVIVGSDRRGAAFGVYELSQTIGVSPWVWWADVEPEHRENLIISKGIKIGAEPSVKYRGIFLNDEDWGLEPWAAKTFEPETGNIGPKTYANIFELLLRLKANMCWSAMHEVTKPFNENPQNARIADDYAIVMGSSHAEPMLRNNVGEWKDDKEKYNFVTNPQGVTNYWQERLKTNGKYENIYTLGMRGIHDSPIQGVKTQAERIPVLEKIIATQRNLLTKYVNPNVEQVPQIFCPYKEVLADYRANLKIPEDVTVVFPDDNFGYIRYFPNAEEQKRPGGFGVYYHISYLGRPLSYLWLETTPPAQIWEEMSKAYDHNMRQFWILNVGDLKPAEIGIEFFMQMAYDAKKWCRENLREYLKAWAKREFGDQNTTEIAEIMDEYYRLGFERKPEHLQWYLPGETPKPSDISAINYGDEMQTRLDAYEALNKRVEAIYENISPIKRDAFYELVLYPVRGAAMANERVFAIEKSVLYEKQHRASAAEWAARAEKAGAQITSDTAYYNEKLAGGKWRGIMTPEIGKGQWTSMRSVVPIVPDSILKMNIAENAKLGVAIEGRETSVSENEIAVLPKLDVFTKGKSFIDVFNQGKTGENWTATANRKWIKLSENRGNLNKDARITISINWKNAPLRDNLSGEIEIKTVHETRQISVPIYNPRSPRPEKLKGFVESNGVISMTAGNFTNKTGKDGAAWQIIKNLGRTNNPVSIFPTTAKSIDPKDILQNSPALEYQFYTFNSGAYEANFFLLPTQPLQAGNGLRLAFSIDDETPQIITVDKNAEVSSPKWASNILNQTTAGNSKFQLNAGAHRLKIYMVDAGVVLDKIVLNGGGMKPSYLAPPETKNIF